MELFVIGLICVICLNVLHCSDGGRTYTYPGVKLSDVPDPFYYQGTGFLNITTCLQKYFPDKNARHECDRPCKVGDNRICYYRLNIESAEAHNPDACSKPDNRDCIITDGVRTPLHVINRQLPGTLIAGCLGDRVVVDVANYMVGFTKRVITEYSTVENLYEGDKNVKKERVSKGQQIHYVPDPKVPGQFVTMHFHGAFQRKTVQCDGVPTIHQDIANPGSFYRYSFVNDNPGTHFYHAHTLGQRSEGVFGPMIVRDPNDVHRKRFDVDDKIVLLTDFGHQMSRQADVILVNSHGCVRKENLTATGYLTKYEVKKGLRYRFRFIYNGITTVKLLCFFEKHFVDLIAVDGNPIKPVRISSFILATGTRSDVILKADQNIGNYLLICIGLGAPDLRQAAILHYKTAEPSPDCNKVNFSIPIPIGVQYNKLNAFAKTPNAIIQSELRSYEQMDARCQAKNIRKYYFILTGSKWDYYINNIEGKEASIPLVNQMLENGYINETDFCDEDSFRKKHIDCSKKLCHCMHTWKLPYNECIELVLTGNHPMHFHRTEFYVVATVQNSENKTFTEEKFEKMDRDGLVERNLKNPPLKDTVDVPEGGAVVIRFVTENLGFLFVHCHVDLHYGYGMSQLLWVGPEINFVKYMEPNHYYKKLQNNICP